MRLVCDVIEFCTQHVPQWNTVSISGYHIREAGSTAVQELAFTLADGFHYVETCLARGMDVDEFAPRLRFFFNAHNDVFEEIAKYRAARRSGPRHMRDRYGAARTRSWKLRFHAQTAGCSLQDQQPEVNLIRVAYQALAAVLGGCQSLHTNSMDETLALPTEHAVTLALRTQQVLAYETGVANTVDPLGGSYFVETLTEQMEQRGRGDLRARSNSKGGMIAAIEGGFFRREIADARSSTSATSMPSESSSSASTPSPTTRASAFRRWRSTPRSRRNKTSNWPLFAKGETRRPLTARGRSPPSRKGQ